MSATKLNPHPFIGDPDIPPDTRGYGACAVCHLIGRAGDAHHQLPDLSDADTEHRRRAGEKEATP